MKESDKGIIKILEAFDATGSAYSAAQLDGVNPKTVRRYIGARDAGRPVAGPVLRVRVMDEFSPKVEEWVERSGGRVRADVVDERLVTLLSTPPCRGSRSAACPHSQARFRSLP